MSIFVRGLLLLGMLVCWGRVEAQSVPAEVRGVYSGTMKLTYYESGTPEKENLQAIITVNESTWEVQMINGSITNFTGSIAASGPYLFGGASSSGLIMGGRLQVKGKPGKQKLSGKLTMGAGSYLGIGDITVNVKKGI